jgi:transcription elongation factor Elf1
MTEKMKIKICKRCGHKEEQHTLHEVPIDIMEHDYYKCGILGCDCEIHANVLKCIEDVYDDAFSDESNKRIK